MGQNTKTMIFNGTVITIKFYSSPEEKMVMYYPDGSGYPGAPEELEINSVAIEDTEWIQYLNNKCLDEIISQLSNNIDE